MRPSARRTPQRWRIGVIGMRRGWSSLRLLRAVRAATGGGTLLDVRDVHSELASLRVRHGRADLADFDALIVKKLGDYDPKLLDRMEILRLLSNRGVRVFSDPDAMIRLLNRLSCSITLRLGGVPMPETVVTESADEALAAIERFRRAVLKPLYTTKARGMLVVSHGREAARRIAEFQKAGNTVMYVQKLLKLPGRDLGVVFLGGEYLATYARTARRPGSHGRLPNRVRYEPINPPRRIVDIARRAQALFGLDFTCVDVAESDDGPVVFEVSAFGGFRGLHAAHGIDAAKLYVDYVVRMLARSRK